MALLYPRAPVADFNNVGVHLRAAVDLWVVFLKPVAADLHMHRVFGAKDRAGIPEVAVKYGRDLKDAALDHAIAAFVELAVKRKIDSAAPGMVRDCRAGAALIAAAAHAHVVKDFKNFRLLRFDVRDDILQ